MTNTSREESLDSTFSGTLLSNFFILNRFALGFGGEIFSNSHSTVGLIGPNALFYFFNHGQVGAYLGANYRFAVGSSTSLKAAAQGTLGAEYFVVPSVGIGPAFFYTRNFMESQYNADFTQYGFSFGLNIYL